MSRQMHLAAHFPGVNNTTVWSDPAAGSQIDFGSFEHLAKVAEAGKMDFFFLAEGLRLREHKGRVFDLDVVGRPDSVTVLAALAAVTERIGLAATINATFNEPYELARQLATLDHLSNGRAAWNVVTSSDAWTGENFRRGGYLQHAERYERADEFVTAARELWDAGAGPFRHVGKQFDIAGEFGVPHSPQGRPVVIQAGDSDQGRELAARQADVVFTRHGKLDAGREFYADVKRRLAAYGRAPDQLKIMPGVTFALGDSEADARERAHAVRSQQVSPANAIQFLEQVWGRDLSAYDADGPLPDIDPDPTGVSVTRGRVRHDDPATLAAKWRAIAEGKRLSIRELIIEVTARQSFVGTPASVAGQLVEFVDADAADGFILVPHLTPGGLDEFVAKVIPELRDRGAFRTDYTGATLREHLGLIGLPPSGDFHPRGEVLMR
jgi:alkanesulfonate monooxygenase SsuD/methylene tetrahydromethanopterin reductase-like flavin-dependent oxidoreductase (luciferase family)